MVAIQAIRQSNARISELPAGLVALFLGGTSGIGRSALEQFAQRAVRPRIYIAARQGSSAPALVQSLRQSNPQGTYTIIEKDVSLVRQTDEVVQFVKNKETKLDLLFMSMGFISFIGRQETSEGLDSSMSTRFYSRARAVQALLPLLKAAPHPRVMCVLAGGQESKLNEDDLDLKKPKSYSIAAAAVHSATMLTLVLERLAKENPEISFVHSFPAFVATTTLTRGSSGVLGFLMRWLVSPVTTFFFATNVEDAGARALFYTTSEGYSVNGGFLPLPSGVPSPQKSGGGVFLVNEKSDSADNEKVLSDFRNRGVDKRVWEHTQEIFAAILREGA